MRTISEIGLVTLRGSDLIHLLSPAGCRRPSTGSGRPESIEGLPAVDGRFESKAKTSLVFIGRTGTKRV